MTPLEIEILLHYYGKAGDYHDGDFRYPAVRNAITAFIDIGLLTTEPENGMYPHRTYHPTAGLRLYVETICKIPLPVKKWVMPDQESQ